MTARRAPRQALMLVTLGALLAPATLALAAAPKLGADVTQVSFTSIVSRDGFSEDNRTAFIGVEECKDAVASNEELRLRYTTRYDLSALDFNGARLFQGAFAYDVARGANSGTTCTSETTTCREIPEAQVTIGATTVDVAVNFSTLTGMLTEDDCVGGQLDREYFAQITFNGANTTGVQVGELRVIIDAVRPQAPASFETLVTESAIQVSWSDPSPSTDRQGYGVFYAMSPFSGGQPPEDISGLIFAGDLLVASAERSSGQVRRALPAGAEIYVTIATRDQAGNYSQVLEPKRATVLDTIDFWEAYRSSGGEEAGGYCASAVGGARPGHGALGAWAALGALLGLHARRRRRASVDAG